MSSSLTSTVHVHAVAPYALRFTVNNSDPTFDLTTVSAAVFKVKHESGDRADWPCTIIEQSATTMLLVHVFATGDVDVGGETIGVEAHLTTPAAPLITESGALWVRAEFQNAS